MSVHCAQHLHEINFYQIGLDSLSLTPNDRSWYIMYAAFAFLLIKLPGKKNTCTKNKHLSGVGEQKFSGFIPNIFSGLHRKKWKKLISKIKYEPELQSRCSAGQARTRLWDSKGQTVCYLFPLDG